jgi:L-serine deaminase
MQSCVARGFEASGLLPGVLTVRRRAPKLRRMLESRDPQDPMHGLDWNSRRATTSLAKTITQARSRGLIYVAGDPSVVPPTNQDAKSREKTHGMTIRE